MDTTQLFLMTIITIMTILALFVGVQVYFILLDFRKLLNECNGILADFRRVGTNIGSGYTEVIGFFAGVKKLFFVLDLLAKKKKKKN